MLVLGRRVDDTIDVNLDEATLLALLEKVRRTGKTERVTFTIVEVRGHQIRVGVEADREIRVTRGEVTDTEPRKASCADKMTDIADSLAQHQPGEPLD